MRASGVRSVRGQMGRVTGGARPLRTVDGDEGGVHDGAWSCLLPGSGMCDLPCPAPGTRRGMEMRRDVCSLPVALVPAGFQLLWWSGRNRWSVI